MISYSIKKISIIVTILTLPLYGVTKPTEVWNKRDFDRLRITLASQFSSQIEHKNGVIHVHRRAAGDESISDGYDPPVDGFFDSDRQSVKTPKLLEHAGSSLAEDELEECIDKPCKNLGVCKDLPPSSDPKAKLFSCICQHGYTGDVCQIGKSTSEYMCT